MVKSDLDFDRDHIWHPYTSALNPTPVQLVESADGVNIKLATGEILIDGMSSWWSALHGYNHPVLNMAITEQLKSMSHIMFGGLTHKPAIELSKKLVEITPKRLEKVFLADTGSVSIEVALKMAIQYWQSKNQPNKSRFITVKNGYHGDTIGAMSVCDPENGMHHIFRGILQTNIFLDAPKLGIDREITDSEKQYLDNSFKKYNKEVAGFIIEPIVQGAGGMRFYSPTYLNYIRELCDKYNILLIFDEIATGFGRTGKLFATNFTNVIPDIMTIGKALTGGYMTLASTITTKEVADTVGLLMHGPTFMGNPLACSVALASINLLLSSNWQERVKYIENYLKQKLNRLKSLHTISDVRVLGAIGVIELHNPVDMDSITKSFINAGIWVRPFGKLVYLMPPFVIISNDELKKLVDGFVGVLLRL